MRQKHIYFSSFQIRRHSQVFQLIDEVCINTRLLQIDVNYSIS